MKPGFTVGSATSARLRVLPVRALPAEAPLDMPRRTVAGDRKALRPGGTRLTAAVTFVLRLLIAAGTALLSGYGIHEMYGVMALNGVTALQWAFLVLFAINFAWISFAGVQSVVGFFRQIALDLLPAGPAVPLEDDFCTAVLVPVYNESPHTLPASLSAMAEGLSREAPGRFAIFVLSDSNKPDEWVAEEAAMSSLIMSGKESCPIYYRHRADNTERKAGNVADWVMRWGRGYDAMLILDADSLMAPETMIDMAARLRADPGLGLLQTLPNIIAGRSLYARLQQFANRCYGPIFGNGLAAWYGRSGNYWGHNAIIRIEAFADAARLPDLKGKPPFGGHVLSHDFVEAAFLRRAGWGVRFDTDLEGSFEEGPPSLRDVIVRDRRWAQGNLQHGRLIFARGFTLASRLHMAVGMMAYLSAMLWFALIGIGLVIAVQAAVVRPEYFNEPSLFPTWPVFDSKRAITLFIVSMAVLLTPKVLGWLAIMINPRRMMRFGGPISATLSVLTEALLSALYAPVMMLAQAQIVVEIFTGGDSGWSSQRRRAGGVRFLDALSELKWHNPIGFALAVLAYLLSPQLFLWLLPLTIGLVLAGPLSWFSASEKAGMFLSRLGILRTPEESRRHKPEIVRTFEENLEGGEDTIAPALSRLAAETDLRDWHRAQVAGGSTVTPFNPPLILGRAKAEQCTDLPELEGWLTREETMALLNDRAFVQAL